MGVRSLILVSLCFFVGEIASESLNDMYKAVVQSAEATDNPQTKLRSLMLRSVGK